MTSECKTSGNGKHNKASSSRTVPKKLHLNGAECPTKKNEKREQAKPVDNKEKAKNAPNKQHEKNPESPNLKTHPVKLQKEMNRKVPRNKRESSTSTPPNQTESCMVDIITEKNRMLNNQQLQIEALTQQVSSLKEVINISKDMLDIRNIEVKQLHDKLYCLDLKFNSKKDQHETVHSKLERMMSINEELKNEYRKQMCMFSELQKRYQEHIANCKNHTIGKENNIVSDNPNDNVDVIDAKPIEKITLLTNEIGEVENQVVLAMPQLNLEVEGGEGLSVQPNGDNETDLNISKHVSESPVADPGLTCEEVANKN